MPRSVAVACRRREVPLVVLWLAAAAYFVLGISRTLEGVDEGHLVYMSWRVSQGALPYREFHHMYGPSTFVLNGLLLRLLGHDLLVVRAGLVVVKATLSVLVYRLARLVAARGWALAVWLVLVAVWGAPLWVFNAPYASIYQTTLTLAGVAGYLTLVRWPRARCLIAGVCFGAGATFKQSGGLLSCVGFLLFLISAPTSDAGPAERAAVRPGHDDADAWMRRLLAAARFAVLVGAAAVFLQYGVSFGGTGQMVLLLGPALALVAWLAVRGVVAGATRGRRPTLAELCWVGAGFAGAPAAYAAVYAAEGAAGSLLHDSLWGLPQTFTLRVPFPALGRPTIAAAAVVGAAVAASIAAPRGRAGGLAVALAVPVAVATLALVTGEVGSATALWGAFVHGAWHGFVYDLVFWIPPLIVWAACAVLWCRRTRGSEPFRALLFLSAATLPVLQPVSDLPHILLALPVFLPLLAFHLTTVQELRPDAPGSRLASGWVLGLCLAAMAAPWVRALVTTTVRSRAAGAGLPHATCIDGGGARVEPMRAVLGYLEAAVDPRAPVLVLPNEAMLYFLAGRPSALEPAEFALYAGTFGQMPEAAARGMADEAAAVARLDVARPVIVRVADAAPLERFRRVFPMLDAYVRDHYRPVATFGPYQVLRHVGPAAE